MSESHLTRGLQSELEEVRGKLDKWVDEQMALLNQGKVQHEEVMKSLEDKIAELRRHEGEVENWVVKAKSRVVEEAKRVDADAQGIEELKGSVAKEAESLEQLRSELQKRGVEVEEAKDTVSKKSKFVRGGVEKEERLLSLNAALGLSFQQEQGGSLRVIFTQISQEDPSREYSFRVNVSDDGVYSTSEFSVQIPNGEELLSKLNQTNDFSRYVKTIRKQFQAVANA